MEKIRVLMAILGLDQHESGAVSVSKCLRDAGMEVIYAGRFNLPPMVVKAAMEESVDVIGLSCHSWEYLYYVPELMDLMDVKGLTIPVIVGGGIITRNDAAMLKKKGVRAVFGASTREEDIIHTIKELAKEDKVLGDGRGSIHKE